MKERQHWIQHKFQFLKSHIRRKGLSKFSGFKSPQRGASASTASAHDTVVCRPAPTLRQHTSHPSILSQPSSVDQQVMDQFGQMKTMLTSSLGPSQEIARTVFCNYLSFEVENLEERDFLK